LAATIPNFLTFHLIKRGNPIFASGYEEDEEKHHTIDVYLISGAIIFGIGWGLGGLSPSPFFCSAFYLFTSHNSDFYSWFNFRQSFSKSL